MGTVFFARPKKRNDTDGRSLEAVSAVGAAELRDAPLPVPRNGLVLLLAFVARGNLQRFERVKNIPARNISSKSHTTSRSKHRFMLHHILSLHRTKQTPVRDKDS